MGYGESEAQLHAFVSLAPEEEVFKHCKHTNLFIRLQFHHMTICALIQHPSSRGKFNFIVEL
jgi:hypothetical protein